MLQIACPGSALGCCFESMWKKVVCPFVVSSALVSCSKTAPSQTNVFAVQDCSDPPSAYTNNYNVDFVNNTIANCASNPFVLTSAAGVSVINTSFVNVLCSSMDVGQCNSWEVKGAIAMVANVQDISFAGNNVVIDANCKLPQGSYDHPVALVNATNVTGLSNQSSISSRLQTEG